MDLLESGGLERKCRRSDGRGVVMGDGLYSYASLYDLMFPGGGPAVDFYRAEAGRRGGQVLELGCGTGHKLIPIASDGFLRPPA